MLLCCMVCLFSGCNDGNSSNKSNAFKGEWNISNIDIIWEYQETEDGFSLDYYKEVAFGSLENYFSETGKTVEFIDSAKDKRGANNSRNKTRNLYDNV